MERQKFTNAEEEKLIDFIRSNEFIYNVQHEFYTNRKLKQMSWGRLAKSLRREVSECTKKWSNMRDNYKKSIEELKATGQVSTNKRELRMKQLSFLADAMTNTRGIGTYRMDTKSEMEGLSESVSVASSPPASPMQEPEVELHEDEPELLEELPTSHDQPKSPVKRTGRPASLTPTQHQQQLQSPTVSALQRYFKTICSTVAEFPLKDQIEMKILINQIVYDRELQLATPIVYVDEDGKSDEKKYFQGMYED